MVGNDDNTPGSGIGLETKQPPGRRRIKPSNEQRAEVVARQVEGAAPSESRDAWDARLAKLLGWEPSELRDAIRNMAEFAASPSDGRLTTRGLAVCDAFKALRTVWPEPYALKCERELLEAIDARDQPRMLRAVAEFVVFNGVKVLLDRNEHLRAAHREGALKTAAKKRGRPSSVASTLRVYEETTNTTVTKVTNLLADRLGVSASQLRRVIAKRKPSRTPPSHQGEGDGSSPRRLPARGMNFLD